ncbi:MAG: DUF1616 domain-containing protein [Thermoprotei archaeon]
MRKMRRNDSEEESLRIIKRRILAILDNNSTISTVDLVRRLVNEGTDEEKIIEAIKALEEEDKIELEYNFFNVSFLQYLKDTDLNFWFYFTITVVMGALMMIFVVPSVWPFVIIRWIFGSLFILFLPGYALVNVFFPRRRDLDDVERLALSVGLSLAITPLTGLLLNYTVFGIRLNPVVATLSIFILGMTFLAVYRKFKIGKALYGEV